MLWPDFLNIPIWHRWVVRWLALSFFSTSFWPPEKSLSAWRSYPPSGTILEVQDFNIEDGRIAFGTKNISTFTGCKLYLLDSTTGTDIVLPVEMAASVDDVEYKDLDGDGDRDLAVLIRLYYYDGFEGYTWWLTMSYDQNLDLLTPSGHFVYGFFLRNHLDYWYVMPRFSDLERALGSHLKY